jgi:asparagine synthase (glutamine-hydrolysing)
MCGIWAWIYGEGAIPDHKTLWEKGVKTLAARGPESDGGAWKDISGVGTFCFTRLAINGLTEQGNQPFEDAETVWMCNGEIYNHAELEGRCGYSSTSGSDCEVLGPWWRHSGKNLKDFAQGLDGVFALALVDRKSGDVILARDPYGVRPLFYIQRQNSLLVASERKALEAFAEDDWIREFPPGEVWKYSEIEPNEWVLSRTKYHQVPYLKVKDQSLERLRTELENAVEKRVENCERPIAALLSGGIDSSLIAALVQRSLQQKGKPWLRTFSIGMKGGTDLAYARKVADWIRSDHTEVIVTEDEMFHAIPEVIRAIESYDITTVRASVGNYLVAKAIREKSDCKVVFNGDGADEVFGSYLYLKNAPGDFEFESETRRLVSEISKYDVLRSDRSIASWGLEARTPFLDRQFVAVAMSYPTELRRPGGADERVEKQLLREAFDDGVTLPKEVLWRKKEAFSDGVSQQEKSWFQIIQEKLEENCLVPDDWRELAKGWNEKHFGIQKMPEPPTPEAFFYRWIYENYYGHTGDYWPYWLPRWSGETTDPSARTLKVYNSE